MNFIRLREDQSAVNLDFVRYLDKGKGKTRDANPGEFDVFYINFFYSHGNRETWIYSDIKLRDKHFVEILDKVLPT